MKATDERAAVYAHTHTFWAYVLSGLGIFIGGLLVAILWKTLMPEAGVVNKTAAPAHEVAATAKTGWQRDAPLHLVISYYQAIRDGNVSQVQSVWEAPNSRPARYAAQAVRESLPNARCQPTQIENVSSANSSDAILSVVLQCHGSAGSQNYRVFFHVKMDKTGVWKIVDLQDAN